MVAELCLQGLFDQNLSSETVGTGKWSFHESQGSIGNGLDAPIYIYTVKRVGFACPIIYLHLFLDCGPSLAIEPDQDQDQGSTCGITSRLG